MSLLLGEMMLWMREIYEMKDGNGIAFYSVAVGGDGVKGVKWQGRNWRWSFGRSSGRCEFE